MSSASPEMSLTRPSAVTEAQAWMSELTMSIVVTVFVAVVTILVVLFFGLWKYKSKVLPSQSEAPRKYRFRKRDKVMFFGRKMLRKVKSFTRNTVGPGATAGMRRKQSSKLMISRLRRFLARRKDSSKPRLKQQSPPQSFLEADWSDIEDDHRLPPEVLYMLRSVRVFGHLEKPFFLELCRYMETITLRSGHFLFKIGDPDDSIYVVQHGLLEVYITDSDGSEHLIKQVATGSSIHSLLSILDVLTGHPGTFRSVSARAVTDSTILRLPAHAFKSMFEKFNESAVKVVQIIMIRLQRVTFSALHNYLGLSKELLRPEGHSDSKELNIHRILRPNQSPSVGSPAKAASTQGAESSKEDAGDVKLTVPGTPHRKSISLTRPLSETGTQISDFDAALMRARASVVDEKSIVLTGSPPRRPSVMEPAASEGAMPSSYRSRTLPDEELILNMAAKDLVQILGLKDPNLLEGLITLSFVRAGSIFCKQGDQDTSFFFLVKGTVSVLQNVVGESSKEALIFQAEPGEIIDVLGVLTGEPSFFTLRAKSDITMAVITKPDFYEIMRVEPFIVLNAAHCTVKRMSTFVRQIDFAIDWQMLEAGKALFRQGDPSESVFIVLTGRLRSVITTMGGKKELVNEFGRGELVGIVEVLTQHERATTVLAVRDTELTKIPSGLLNLIKLRYPQVVARLIHLLGTRILGNIQQRNSVNLSATVPLRSDSYEKMERTTVDNLATIAIVPVTEDVPLTNFALELQHALLTIGPTVRLTPDIVKARLGTAALDGVNEFRLFSWLSQQEDIHRMVLYQCDHQLTKWSKHCLRQADCILIVGLADKEPSIGPIERELENVAVRAQKELILLYKEDAETPRNTSEWLNARGWLSSHHHIRCPKRVFKYKSAAKTLEVYERLFETQPDRMADFSRLARFLTGMSIGLVLGGGGARGLAHVGMIRAMQEEGIPIDMVGGTSMGSFIGALWAEERNYTRFTQRAREWAVGMSSLWKKIWDLTYPVASMFTGWAFNESIEGTFHDRQIEDLWIPYFCVTTNISSSSMRVHTLGSIWRYVRASMSLSGYLPPLCDPVDGHLLLDGGYVNNLPADVMHNLGAKFVFAVDVGSQDETDLTNYGDSLSGWWLLWKRWNPWAKPVRVPDMTEIQSRLAYVSCVRQLEVVKNSDYCEYIRPPIDRYATLQFGSYDEIVETGFHHGKTLFQAWSKGGLLDKLFKETAPPSNEARAQKDRHSSLSHVPVMAYFTDLAEQASKIEEPRSKFYLNDDSEEEVIDDNEEDDPALLEGYEEDDEFAHSEGEEEVSEDGEEHEKERRKVKSLLPPLCRLGGAGKKKIGETLEKTGFGRQECGKICRNNKRGVLGHAHLSAVPLKITIASLSSRPDGRKICRSEDRDTASFSVQKTFPSGRFMVANDSTVDLSKDNIVLHSVIQKEAVKKDTSIHTSLSQSEEWWVTPETSSHEVEHIDNVNKQHERDVNKIFETSKRMRSDNQEVKKNIEMGITVDDAGNSVSIEGQVEVQDSTVASDTPSLERGACQKTQEDNFREGGELSTDGWCLSRYELDGLRKKHGGDRDVQHGGEQGVNHGDGKGVIHGDEREEVATETENVDQGTGEVNTDSVNTTSWSGERSSPGREAGASGERDRQILRVRVLDGRLRSRGDDGGNSADDAILPKSCAGDSSKDRERCHVKLGNADTSEGLPVTIPPARTLTSDQPSSGMRTQDEEVTCPPTEGGDHSRESESQAESRERTETMDKNYQVEMWLEKCRTKGKRFETGDGEFCDSVMPGKGESSIGIATLDISDLCGPLSQENSRADGYGPRNVEKTWSECSIRSSQSFIVSCGEGEDKWKTDNSSDAEEKKHVKPPSSRGSRSSGSVSDILPTRSGDCVMMQNKPSGSFHCRTCSEVKELLSAAQGLWAAGTHSPGGQRRCCTEDGGVDENNAVDRCHLSVPPMGVKESKTYSICTHSNEQTDSEVKRYFMPGDLPIDSRMRIYRIIRRPTFRMVRTQPSSPQDKPRSEHRSGISSSSQKKSGSVDDLLSTRAMIHEGIEDFGSKDFLVQEGGGISALKDHALGRKAKQEVSFNETAGNFNRALFENLVALRQKEGPGVKREKSFTVILSDSMNTEKVKESGRLSTGKETVCAENVSTKPAETAACLKSNVASAANKTLLQQAGEQRDATGFQASPRKSTEFVGHCQRNTEVKRARRPRGVELRKKISKDVLKLMEREGLALSQNPFGKKNGMRKQVRRKSSSDTRKKTEVKDKPQTGKKSMKSPDANIMSERRLGKCNNKFGKNLRNSEILKRVEKNESLKKSRFPICCPKDIRGKQKVTNNIRKGPDLVGKQGVEGRRFMSPFKYSKRQVQVTGKDNVAQNVKSPAKLQNKGNIESKQTVNESLESKQVAKDTSESEYIVEESLELKQAVKEKLESKHVVSENLESKQAEKDKLESKQAAKEKLESKEVVKEKLESKEVVKEKVESKQAVKEKLEIQKATEKNIESKQAVEENVEAVKAEKIEVIVPTSGKILQDTETSESVSMPKSVTVSICMDTSASKHDIQCEVSMHTSASVYTETSEIPDMPKSAALSQTTESSAWNQYFEPDVFVPRNTISQDMAASEPKEVSLFASTDATESYDKEISEPKEEVIIGNPTLISCTGFKVTGNIEPVQEGKLNDTEPKKSPEIHDIQNLECKNNAKSTDLKQLSGENNSCDRLKESTEENSGEVQKTCVEREMVNSWSQTPSPCRLTDSLSFAASGEHYLDYPKTPRPESEMVKSGRRSKKKGRCTSSDKSSVKSSRKKQPRKSLSKDKAGSQSKQKQHMRRNNDGLRHTGRESKLDAVIKRKVASIVRTTINKSESMGSLHERGRNMNVNKGIKAGKRKLSRQRVKEFIKRMEKLERIKHGLRD